MGAYYFDQEIETDSLAIGKFFTELTFANAIFWSFDTQNVALFGNGDWALSDRWSVFAGARALRETPRLLLPTLAGRRSAALGLRQPRREPCHPTSKTRALTWRVGTQFELGPQSMAFAKVVRGYKGGGFNATNTILIVDVVEPEIPTNFELGFRTRSAGNRVHAGVVAFHTRFKDFQAEVWDPLNITFELSNAGRVETEGIEPGPHLPAHAKPRI